MHDMLKYVRSWLASHNKNKEDMKKVQGFVDMEMTNVRHTIQKMKGNMSLDEVDEKNLKHWMDATDKGIKQWAELSTSRMKQLETVGPKLMKNEMISAFIGKQGVSFDDYLHQIGRESSKAYGRMNIPTKDNDIFSNVASGLVELFKEGAVLTDMEPHVVELEKSLDTPDKRTLACTTKIA